MFRATSVPERLSQQNREFSLSNFSQFFSDTPALIQGVQLPQLNIQLYPESVENMLCSVMLPGTQD